MYSPRFQAAQDGTHAPGEKIYVPIDLRAVAEKIGNDPHILFGRLYYHLDAKYRYKNDDGIRVHLFTLKVGANYHCINYPLLAAILSEHLAVYANEQRNFWLAIVALIFSLAAIIAQVVSSLQESV